MYFSIFCSSASTSYALACEQKSSTNERLYRCRYLVSSLVCYPLEDGKAKCQTYGIAFLATE